MASDGVFDALPKAELHIHIEGSLEPLRMLVLAACNGVELHDVNQDEGPAGCFSQGQDFLIPNIVTCRRSGPPIVCAIWR